MYISTMYTHSWPTTNANTCKNWHQMRGVVGWWYATHWLDHFKSASCSPVEYLYPCGYGFWGSAGVFMLMSHPRNVSLDCWKEHFPILRVALVAFSKLHQKRHNVFLHSDAQLFSWFSYISILPGYLLGWQGRKGYSFPFHISVSPAWNLWTHTLSC